MNTPTMKTPRRPKPHNTSNSIIRYLQWEGGAGVADVRCYPARAVSFKPAWSPFLLLALAASVALATATAQAQESPRPLTPDPLRYVSPSRAVDFEHTALDLDVDLQARRVAGHVTHTVRALRDNLTALRLNAVEINVDSVTVNGSRARFEYPVKSDQSTSWLAGASAGTADDQIAIVCDPPLARGKKADVRVYYSATPEIGLYWIRPEKGIPDKRYEAWSQGEGEENRYWIPCNDYPNDKATYEGRFRVGKSYTAISNGTLVETREVGGKKEFYWKLEQPQVTYLIMLAVAEYKILEQKAGDIPLPYVVPPGTDDATILRGYGLTPDMMAFFEKEIGIPYPFSKYAQVVVQDYIYGGMENTTATVMNMRTLYDERTEPTRTEQGLVAHELAHQWWGDMLTCREWSQMWLNEGFATYYAYLYRKHHDGDDAFLYQLHGAHDDVIKADDAEPRPMVVDFFNRTDARNNALVYVKGASVLHMLRTILGDDLYRETIRHYGEENQHDVVDTQDLMRAVRETTGENLDWFFEQWVFLAGHPKFKVSKSWDKESRVVTLKVEQTQKAGGLVPVFRVPVDVEIAWEGGRETHSIVIEDASESYHFQVPMEPKMVIFDKGNAVLKTLDFPKTAGEAIYELEHGDFMTRVRAAQTLGAKGSDARTVPALKSVVLGGSYWGLRREAALALGKIENDDALEALIEGSKVKEARVRLACAEAMGSFYRNEKAASQLDTMIKNDFAYGVRAAAVTALVKTRGKNAARISADALKQESDQGIVRNAALNGLADLGDPAALDRIKGYTTSGNPRWYRHAAIGAYGKLAKLVEKDGERRRAAEFLYPSLDDWHLRTRAAAIDALAAIAEPSSVDPLRRVAENDRVAEVRERAKKAADRIAAESGKTTARNTAAEIEDLKRRIESLERELEAAKKKLVAPPAEMSGSD
ncbi:MAG TPA: M1 family aminopeptidase [Candidatus Krumholzibacteria bacterium]|nr:M1 family aminopeptidase [Candidatus Krumholzibacteria bacterium]